MGQLEWMKVEVDLPSHPKTRALKLRLKEPLADAYVTRLWAWVTKYHPRGRIPPPYAVELIEDACGWQGEPGGLVAAFVDCRWLDVDGDAYQLHNWDVRQGALIAHADKQREEARERQARSRAARAQASDTSRPSRVTRPKVTRDKRVTSYSISKSVSASVVGVEGEAGAAAAATDGGQGDATAPPVLGDGEAAVTDPLLSVVPPPPAEELLPAAWNELCCDCLPRVEALNEHRVEACRAALQRRPYAQWREVFASIAASSFCRGEGRDGWVADFDWAIRPGDRRGKPEPAFGVLEGKYTDRTPQARAPPASRSRRPSISDNTAEDYAPRESP